MNESISHISPVWPSYTDIVAERGEGCYIYAQDGQAYLDFTCGIGVTNTGHCHPRVVEAVRAQAGKLLHGQANIVWHAPLLELIDTQQLYFVIKTFPASRLRERNDARFLQRCRSVEVIDEC